MSNLTNKEINFLNDLDVLCCMYNVSIKIREVGQVYDAFYFKGEDIELFIDEDLLNV